MRAAREIFTSFITVIASLTVALACLYGILLIFGFRTFILNSDSMEPSYQKGSFIIAETRIHPDDLKIGDVIVYKASSDAPVMHRLVAQNTLKGDANQISEHVELNDSNLIGRVRYSVFSPILAGSISILKKHTWLPIGLLCFFTIVLFSCSHFYSFGKEEKHA